MYDREIEGQEFTFGVSGKLIRNVLVMFDRQTQSLWSQLLGEAVEGEMVGTKLTYLPSWLMTWDKWKELHPDTVALDKDGRRGAQDTYDSYYASDRAGVIDRTHLDDRLHTKEFVIGVELDNITTAYPFGRLSQEPLINDTVGDHRLLIVFDPDSGAGSVFNRRLAGRILTFSQDDDQLLMTDSETGTIWETFSGRAVEGPLKGSELQRLKSVASFWFGWVDFHPNTLLYGFE